jgi:pyruvate kinase
MMDRANAYLLGHGMASPGDKVVAVFGAPVGVSGTTNAVQVRVLG